MLEAVRPSSLATATAFGPQSDRRPDVVTLHSLLDVLRRRSLALLVCLLGTLLIAAAYVSVTPKKYAAVSTLLIDSRLAQLSQTEASGGTVVDQAAVESQIELLRSEKMLVPVIDKLNLIADPEFGAAVGAAAEKGSPVSAEVAQRRAVAVLASSLWVARVGRSYLVDVTYNSRDPVKAATIANDVVAAYIADQVEAKVQASRDQSSWLDAQVGERRSRVAQTYRAVQDFKASHDSNALSDFGGHQDLDRYSGEASRARAAVLAARTGMSLANRILADPAKSEGKLPDLAVLHGLADPELDRLSEQAVRRSEAQTSTPASSADAPQRTGLQAVWDRVANVASQRRADWITATAKQQAVEATLADLRLRDTRNHLVQERLRELETEAATSRSLYESYLNQLTHAAQQQPVPASDTRVISKASVPLFPSSPRKPLTLALAAVAGTMLGLSAMFILESLDDVVRTRHCLETTTDLPCIGVVPKLRRGRKTRKAMPLSSRLRDRFPGLVGSSPRSKMGDMLRALQFAAYNGACSRGAPTLGITSAVAGEGKTTIAVNLAVSASQSGRRVLLVDCNLRNPTLTHTVLADGSAMAPGFGLQHSVRADDGFDVLPASPQNTIDGAEIPDAELLDQMLGEARAAYDLIIVDLPAILPLSELRTVVHQMDLLVLVTRWGTTTTSQIERAMGRFADAQRLVGVVLNAAKVKTMRRFEGSTQQTYADRV